MHWSTRAVIFVWLLGMQVAAAQDYPSRVVRFIVPDSPGADADIVARAVADRLAASFGLRTDVANHPGYRQTTGTALAVRAPADGHTILLVSVTHTINPALDPTLPYDSTHDLEAITLIASRPHLVVVHPSVPVRSSRELLALAQAKPGKLNLATSGLGSAGHLAGALFASLAKLRVTTIHYKGASPAHVDLMAGEVDLMFTSPNPALYYARAGQLRALATTGAERSPAAPELPTLAQAAGLSGYEASQWYGIMAPAGTPREVVQWLNSRIVQAMAAPDARASLARLAVSVIGSSSEAFREHLRDEARKWAGLIEKVGIREQ